MQIIHASIQTQVFCKDRYTFQWHQSHCLHGVTEKNGARQVLGRVDYASWSTLPYQPSQRKFSGTQTGVERPVEGWLALD